MQVKETITRDCCKTQDLRPYSGLLAKGDETLRGHLRFCIHCGQVRLPDCSREPGFERPDRLGVVGIL